MPAAILLLDHVGAKSGTKRTSPLLYVRDGENVVVVASKGGFPKHPAWFHNLDGQPGHDGPDRLRASPGPRPRRHRPEERERLWPIAVKAYHGYADYQARSAGREIPLVILEPRKSRSVAASGVRVSSFGRRSSASGSPASPATPPAARGRTSCRGRRRS